MTTIALPQMSLNEYRDVLRSFHSVRHGGTVMGMANHPEISTDTGSLVAPQVISLMSVAGGIGTSSIAVALLDQLSSTTSTRLIDTACPITTGLADVGENESTLNSAWIRSYRGEGTILRLAQICPSMPEVPEANSSIDILDIGTRNVRQWENQARQDGVTVLIGTDAPHHLAAMDAACSQHRLAAVVIATTHKPAVLLAQMGTQLRLLHEEGRLITFRPPTRAEPLSLEPTSRTFTTVAAQLHPTLNLQEGTP